MQRSIQITDDVDYLIVNHDIEEARPAILLARVVLPEEVLLGVAGHLRRSSCGHEVPRDPSPVALAQLLQPGQECSMFFLCPWNPYGKDTS